MLPRWNRTLSSFSPPPSPPPLLRFIYSNRFGHDYKAVDAWMCCCALHAYTLLTRSIRLEQTTAVKINARLVSYAPLIIADGDSLHPRGIIFAKRSPLSFLFSFDDQELESLRIVWILPLSFSLSPRETGEFEICFY